MVKRRKRKLRKGVVFLFLLLIVGGVGTYLVLTGKIKFKEEDNKTNVFKIFIYQLIMM